MGRTYVIHGEAQKTPEYAAWRNLMKRCYNKNATGYSRYGGAGITVCKRWRLGDGNASGYECFLADMGRRPSASHSVDRKKNTKGYTPSNCRWATRTEQNRNKRTNVFIEYAGKRYLITDLEGMFGFAGRKGQNISARARLHKVSRQEAFEYLLKKYSVEKEHA